MDKYIFLREDYEGLLVEIKRNEEEYKRWGKVSTEDGGVGDWHDNPAYEEGMRQMAMLNKRIRELKEIQYNSQVVEPSKNTSERIILGSKVIIEFEHTGTTKEIMVGSYMTFRKEPSVGKYSLISYSSPLVRAILGKEENDEVEVRIGTQKRRVTILEIQ